MKKVLLACACLLAVTALAGCGSRDSTTAATDTTTTGTTTADATTTDTTTAAKPTVVSITVVNGAPQGGIHRQTISKGDKVVIVVKSDVSDEIHLHGYDKAANVTAGGTARLPFTATLPGRFEVELESRGVQIADLTVE